MSLLSVHALKTTTIYHDMSIVREGLLGGFSCRQRVEEGQVILAMVILICALGGNRRQGLGALQLQRFRSAEGVYYATC